MTMDTKNQPAGYDALSELGRAEFERTGKMPPSSAAVAGAAVTRAWVGDEATAEREAADGSALALLVECTAELQDMQQARAEKSNLLDQASDHVRNAIRCLEEQAKADARDSTQT